MCGMLSSRCRCPIPEYTSVRMRLHAETPVGPAEGHGVPLAVLLSSVTRLLALEQLVVQSETWKATDEREKKKSGWRRAVCVCVCAQAENVKVRPERGSHQKRALKGSC